MQTLDVISINLWQILISLANLLLLFLILKKFLYKPVKKVMAQRDAALEEQYAAAREAEQTALSDKAAWEQKLQGAQQEADAVLKAATARAGQRGDEIVAEAREKAEDILRQAERAAEMERKKAEADIRQEIVEVSTQLAEKMLEREVRAEDHRSLIDAFIGEIGDGHDGDQ